MIETWAIWQVDLSTNEGHEADEPHYVLIVSSEFHLRVNVGRVVMVAPITTEQRSRLKYRPAIVNPHTGEDCYIITDQIRSVDTSRLVQPSWALSGQEIAAVQYALRFMLDI